MTNRQELHKFIVEYFGGCWHGQHVSELICHGNHWTCACGVEIYTQAEFMDHKKQNPNPNLDTPDGAHKVWLKMREDKKRWEKFIEYMYADKIHVRSYAPYFMQTLCYLIDQPSRFIDAVGIFLKEYKP